MRLIVLDEDFETLGAIPLFRTLIWIRRYQKLGAFELYTTKEYFPLLSKGRYLYRNDVKELAKTTSARVKYLRKEILPNAFYRIALSAKARRSPALWNRQCETL